MRLMLQAQHAQPARQPDRPRRRLSQRLPAQERHQQRPLKHQKCCRCRVFKSAAATSAGAAKTSETNAAASQKKSAATSASTATTKASEAATSARDASVSKVAAKSSETSAASSAGSAASSATAAGNSAKAAKRLRRMRITAHRRQQTHKLHRQIPRQQPKIRNQREK